MTTFESYGSSSESDSKIQIQTDHQKTKSCFYLRV